jgi:hypothetical protein
LIISKTVSFSEKTVKSGIFKPPEKVLPFRPCTLKVNCK